MTTTFVKALRANSSDAERRLWRRLRDRQVAGFKFRRQAPFGPYVADFVCHEARLIVEVDGGQHGERVQYDERRTAWLDERGYEVLRFWNHEVLQETDAVLEVVRRSLFERTPHPNPLPQGERGQDPVDERVESKQASPSRSTRESITALPLTASSAGDSSHPAPSPLTGEGRGEGETQTPRAAHGFALVTALIFLLVITLLGVSLFLGVNLQQKAAGNTLQKTRALQLANSATMAAERWLAQSQQPQNPHFCAGTASTVFRTCFKPPVTPNQPGTWKDDATPIVFAKLDATQSGGANAYYCNPRVWITNLGRATFGTHGYLYRINTYACGGNAKSQVVTQAVFYVGGSTTGSTSATSLSP